MSNKVLTAPARVGGTNFAVGIDWETVIKAAQRNYQDSLEPGDSSDNSVLAMRVAELTRELSMVKRVANEEAQKVVTLAAERDSLALEVDALTTELQDLRQQLRSLKL